MKIALSHDQKPGNFTRNQFYPCSIVTLFFNPEMTKNDDENFIRKLLCYLYIFVIFCKNTKIKVFY